MQTAMSASRARFTFTLTLLLLSLGAPAWSGNDPYERDILKGIPVIQVLVELRDSNAERDGLTKTQLQTDVEVRLRKAGIRVASSGLLPVLRLDVMELKRSASEKCVYALRLELHQEITLVRNPNVSFLAATWDTSYLGEVGANAFSRVVRDNVADMVDQFINVYLEHNPKQ
jgi:hypothetical protein